MQRSFTRLQTLRECVYQASTKTCTCFAGIMDPRSIDHDGNNKRFKIKTDVFNNHFSHPAICLRCSS